MMYNSIANKWSCDGTCNNYLAEYDPFFNFTSDPSNNFLSDRVMNCTEASRKGEDSCTVKKRIKVVAKLYL